MMRRVEADRTSTAPSAVVTRSTPTEKEESDEQIQPTKNSADLLRAFRRLADYNTGRRFCASEVKE